MAGYRPDPRKEARSLITFTLAKAPRIPAAARPDLAARLEQACHDGAAGGGPTYTERYMGLVRGLNNPYGKYLETTLADQVAAGGIQPAEAVTPEVYGDDRHKHPRNKTLAMLYARLNKVLPPQEAGPLATQIEKGAYNYSLQRCQQSQASYQQQWDSPMFLNIYSYKIGMLVLTLDTGGTVAAACEAEGAGRTYTLDRLVAGAWPAAEVGGMTAEALCPPANQRVRDMVAHRQRQRVEEKASSLYACPNCHKRNHTYRERQVRALDEGSTITCRCLECGTTFTGHH